MGQHTTNHHPHSGPLRSAGAPGADEAGGGGGGERQQTRLAPRWVRKSIIIVVVLVAFGFWGLADAIWIYPKRGANVAEYRELKYLEQYQQTRGVFDGNVPIRDPADEYARLTDKAAGRNLGDPVEETRRQWLEALDRIGQLDAAQTAFPRDDFRGVRVEDPQRRFEYLRDAWTRVGTAADPNATAQRDPPKPLASWDIPSQWAIMAVCWAIGAVVAVGFVRGARKRFQWEPGPQRLTLDDGTSIVPTDIEEVDKRRWHKFYVTLKIAATHPQHGGKDLELDLYRYIPLEEWVLAMERTRFPESAADEESSEEGAASEAGAEPGMEGGRAAGDDAASQNADDPKDAKAAS